MESPLNSRGVDSWASWQGADLGVLCDYCYDSKKDCPFCGEQALVQPSSDPFNAGAFFHAEAPVSPRSGDDGSHSHRAAFHSAANLTKINSKDSPQEPFNTAEAMITSSQLLSVPNDSRNDEEIPPYRRHTKSKAQIKLLKDWFEVNPTPTGQKLSEYAKASGLEKDQVRNWFVNQRRRRPKASPVASGQEMARESTPPPREAPLKDPMDITTTTVPIPIPGRSRRPSSLTSSLRSLPDAPESMLERWHNSPPDEEPADLTAIKNALASSEIPRTPWKRHFKRPAPTEQHVMVVIQNVPRNMGRTQFVQIMLLKDIKRPLRFFYQYQHRSFSGLALAEFASGDEATFAISRLDHILLEGNTLTATLETDFEVSQSNSNIFPEHRRQPEASYPQSWEMLQEVLPASFAQPSIPSYQNYLANYFENRSSHGPARSDSWRSAPSTDGSAVSSASRSNASSVSIARRKYKEAYRRSDYGQNPVSGYISSGHSPILSHSYDNLYQDISNRPPTPIPPLPSVLDIKDRFNALNHSQTLNNVRPKPERILNAEAQLAADEVAQAPVQLHQCLRYRCEFCIRKFNTEEEWREHETLLHRPREEWVCSLAPCMKPTMKDWLCAFCQAKFTDWDIFIKHPCQVCGLAPGSSTTRPVFHNRTDLADHIRHHHGRAGLTPFIVANWSRASTAEGGIWPCGTCGASLQGWENRLDHIGGHFSAEIMKNTCGCLEQINEAAILDDDLEMLSNLSISTRSSKRREEREPPSSTILITNLNDPEIFRTDNLQSVKDLISESVTIKSFNPIESIRLIIVSFFDEESAIQIRRKFNRRVIMGQRVKIFFTRMTYESEHEEAAEDQEMHDTSNMSRSYTQVNAETGLEELHCGDVSPAAPPNDLQNSSGGFMSRARAWITRRIKRL